MFTRFPFKAVDNDGNIVTLTETHRRGVVETANGCVEFFKMPQMRAPDGALLTYIYGLYCDGRGQNYRIDPEPEAFHRDLAIVPQINGWRRS